MLKVVKCYVLLGIARLRLDYMPENFFYTFHREMLKEYLPDMQVARSPTSAMQEPLAGFAQSVSNDLKAANSVADSLDLSSVEQVVEAMDKCQGQLLISGVGRYSHMYMYPCM